MYFGYGIWHSKENHQELQQSATARYVVFPNGSLEERVQAVQPPQPGTGPEAQPGGAGHQSMRTARGLPILPHLLGRSEGLGAPSVWCSSHL